MTDILDYRVYNAEMEKSMQDKLFWLNIVPQSEWDTVLDYGCANGMFLGAMQKALKVDSHKKLYGIDIDPQMLREAHENCPCAFLSLSIDSIPKSDKERAVLNLSSVIHEVYSYRTDAEIKSFWKFVFHSGFKYICIRDMCISDTIVGLLISWDEFMHLHDTRDQQTINRIKAFEAKWGNIRYQNNFVHYSLKYRYVANWDREVRENYLPLSYENFLSLVPENYGALYQEHYTLPFLKQKVQEDWMIDFNYKTHIKMILELKK